MLRFLLVKTHQYLCTKVRFVIYLMLREISIRLVLEPPNDLLLRPAHLHLLHLKNDTHRTLRLRKVAEHYNARWRAIREQGRRATALTEIRATHAQLQRPIPTLTTSLGANSTPVTIQLPELKIASVKTTVHVPLGIELDEDP